MSKISNAFKAIGVSILFTLEYLVIRAICSNLVYEFATRVPTKFDGLSRQEIMVAVTIPNLLIGNLMVIIVFYFVHMKKHQVEGMLIQVGRPSNFFRYIVIGLTVNTIMSIVITILFSGSDVSVSNETTTQVMELVAVPVWLNLIASGLVTPIAEELIYRAGIMCRLRKSMSDGLAIFLSALIFGAMHMNMVQGVYAFVLGVVFGIFVCRANGNPLPSIIMHIVINSTSLILTYLGMSNLFVMVWLICTFWLIMRVLVYLEKGRVN